MHDNSRNHVLCVDDSWDTCEILSASMPQMRFTFGRSYAAGLTFVKRGFFDLYLLDNWLPDGSGLELCREIRKIDSNTPVVFLSAKTGAGVASLFELIRQTFASASRRISTGELNRFVEQLRFEERKIFYITQASTRPPTFVLFTNRGGPLHFSHERYLINQIRRKFGFKGTPIVLKTRAKEKMG